MRFILEQAMFLFIIMSTAAAQAKYEAHEWGTFTSVVGSDGLTLNGMYHEDEDLPSFVHPFGELRAEIPVSQPPTTPPKPKPPGCENSKVCFNQTEISQSLITQKMETPVIYFYADQAVRVQVNVQFPEGIITETYPGPVATFPTMTDPHIIGKGNTTFDVNVLNTRQGNIPFVSTDNIYSHARNVNSNIITSGAETEKFIFYRGLGRFQPKIEITSKNGDLMISKINRSRPLAAVLVHVNSKGDDRMLPLDLSKAKDRIVVNANKINELMNHSLNSSFVIRGEQAKGKLIDDLVQSGLYIDEATAMINTWEHGYLKVPGLRLLYILPETEVNELLPIQFSPRPEKLIRSFVGRMEILLDTEEQKILQQIQTEQNRFQVQSLGRFAEPILHRIKAIALKSEKEGSELLNLIEILLKQASVGFKAKSSVK